jgi:hypothetical protein
MLSRRGMLRDQPRRPRWGRGCGCVRGKILSASQANQSIELTYDREQRVNKKQRVNNKKKKSH